MQVLNVHGVNDVRLDPIDPPGQARTMWSCASRPAASAAPT